MGLARPGFADRIRDTTVLEDAQPFETEGRPGAVAQEALAPFTIARRNDNTGMHVESSRAATASVGSRWDGRRNIVGAEGRSALRWQRRQLPEPERAFQAGVERRTRCGTVASVGRLLPEKTRRRSHAVTFISMLKATVSSSVRSGFGSR